MKIFPRFLVRIATGDPQAARVVPPTGFTAQLTVFVAGAMAFLAVFALALSLASGRLATQWGEQLARSATVRIVAPLEQRMAQTDAAMAILETTRGVATARPLSDAEQAALLAPWFGPDLALDTLPVPRLIELTEDGDGFDAAGLRLRLQAEVPGAVLDDHQRWRAPLVQAAGRLRTVGWTLSALIGLSIAAMVTLAANAALSANAQVIAVLRLVGATDHYIAQAFIRRFTLRTLFGAAGGMLAGMVAMAFLPSNYETGGFLTGLGFEGWHWAVPLSIPALSGAVAYFATGAAARRTLKDLA